MTKAEHLMQSMQIHDLESKDNTQYSFVGPMATAADIEMKKRQLEAL